MPRAYWKGYLKLSLVNCPVELFPAITGGGKTRFHQINAKTGHRLRQQMVDEKSGRVVDKDDKGRGYELSKGKYVAITADELDAIEFENTHVIDIESFVPVDEIDKRYFDRGYYIAPRGKVGADAFAVIRDAMKDKDRFALARIVIANREHTIALEPLDKGIIGTVLRYDHEVRDAKSYFSGIKAVRPARDMVKLAEHILESMKGKFAPEKFKDRYELALRKLVKKKSAGRKIEAPKPKPKDDNVIDLREALKRSLDGSGGAKKKRRKKAA
ncbi:putative DNA repair protein YkoV [Variibacter gotjawalensis]|uniref:Non-homologous end joining protein Ku n=1 Tax=Variibacter gotjawalensis TaxID=1333996 RepID=A0A0S3PZ18_9BRAD|nr:Ku protein [Variibacter gotjawalensis]NIK47020.1 Ku protein [Variibacter gotjawalensis]RZS48925.1 Ku protein [Variibacter gotjawalensis]BAT61183.1 putative DNA repair protein YkoV [Variibacter gotjawalensis]